jgi:acetylornithine deacetylase/succinyl-diaminopimelate desuccinylase-like protein
VESIWDASAVPALMEFIRIPSKSPVFDPQWRDNGCLEKAAILIRDWFRTHPIPGMKVEIVGEPGRTPLLFAEIPGSTHESVLIYGHLDTQPEAEGWRTGLGPWTPVMESDRLYGRGAVDDGYAAFAAIAAIRALHEQDIPHAHCVILIEACEESGSTDLPYYLDVLAERIGTPGLIVCLDAGCGDYQRLWCTTSLRGVVLGNLRVDALREAVHSGDASGIVPSTFRIVRALLSRLEDEKTGNILPPELHVRIPRQRLEQAGAAARVLGEDVYARFPLTPGMQPVIQDLSELVLNRTWRSALSVTGIEGLPPLEGAANVLQPRTTVRISLRLPPTCESEAAGHYVKTMFEDNPPYGAQVRFEFQHAAQGWNAPDFRPWLLESLDRASRSYFGNPAAYMGEGGSIAFMSMLGQRFPRAQFLITGVMGPQSNAHGPNECLYVPAAKKLTCCVAQVLADHGGF